MYELSQLDLHYHLVLHLARLPYVPPPALHSLLLRPACHSPPLDLLLLVHLIAWNEPVPGLCDFWAGLSRLGPGVTELSHYFLFFPVCLLLEESCYTASSGR